MLHGIIGNKIITRSYLRFETDSGTNLDPTFTIGGVSTLEWISPDGSISTGAIPNPVLDQIGIYRIRCSDWSDVTALSFQQDNLIVLDNLHLLTSLSNLDCFNNNLSVLDVSALTLLTSINCENNNLSVLDVSALTLLTTFLCFNNNLSVLDVSALTLLTAFSCESNSMNSDEIDYILAGLVAAGASNGLAVMHGTNAAPSAAGTANKAILVGRGWTVVTS